MPTPTPTTYIALLRAVNLAGKNAVNMGVLRDLLTSLGLQDVQTLLQSGNVVFQGTFTSTADAERTIERACRPVFKFDLDVFVRTLKEWDAVVAKNPFAEAAANDPAHLVVVACRHAVSSHAVTQLQQAIAGREIVQVVGKQLYVTYPDGIGTSKLTAAVIEKRLGTRGTARNWNTVLKLQARAQTVASVR